MNFAKTLGIIGALLAMGLSLTVISVDSIARVLEEDSLVFTILNFVALAMSFVGLFGAIIMNKAPLKGGVMLIASAVACTMSVSMMFLVPIVLLCVAGLISLSTADDLTEANA
ncbi:hypothetical protein [Listeria rustica]|uniref:DUF4064 domain-containing protein n=1 Tax=Listeria rustica TaxID=2713503 RepID=A0A7W1YFC1_9LIST|nr:hypothetical protein [Listeria rustica]MBA3925428.1 hypothetical protein [Listeria rustica]